jgi:iron complex transport system ATP-binding protein
MITVRDLSFGYGNAFTLKNIQFDVAQGGFCGIIGPNGSGKSTLLKVISKVLEPRQGVIEINGISTRKLSLNDLAKQMAVVGSESQFAFPYRVFDVVLMGRIPFVGRIGVHSQKDFAKVEEALQKTETFEFRDRFIHELSSGERQRVLLARALAQEPQILLLDEPTAHLDLHYEIQIFQILKALNTREKITVLAVSHNLNLMAEFCKQLIVLQAGQCKTIGTPAEVLTAELLRDVFRIDCQVSANPFSHSPTILLNSDSPQKHEGHQESKK